MAVAGTAGATSFTGTPSPNLSPKFGVLVDFDDKATGTTVNSNDYVAWGVASITELNNRPLGRYAGTQSSPNYVGTGTGYGWDGDIRIQLALPANKIGIGVANSSDGETLTIYDSAMNVLESSAVPMGLNTYAGFTRSNFDISYMDISGSFFAIDDLQFKPIPEPLTMLGVFAGLAGIGGYLRKRRRA